MNNDKRNIPDIKMEAKILEEKAKKKKLLLKYEKSSGNIQKIDKLSSEISQLYYNSIQAKLKILNKINNELKNKFYFAIYNPLSHMIISNTN